LTSWTPIPSKSSDQQEGRGEVPPEPRAKSLIHPLAALVLMVIDALWTMADWATVAWIFTIPLSFFAVLLPAFFIQKHMNGDSAGKAMAVSAFLGILAAVPTPIMGTTVGAIALALSGLRSLRRER
jgi:hypothetical protein